MKKLSLTLGMIILLALCSVSEANAESFMKRVHFEAALGGGTRNHNLTPLDPSFRVGVDIIPVLYVFATVEDNISLYKDDNIKTYSRGTGLGGGLGVKFLNSVPGPNALDLRMKVLGTVGNSSMKRTTYDASLAWYLKSKKFSPLAEIGYRYLDSRTTGIRNSSHLYISIGMRY